MTKTCLFCGLYHGSVVPKVSAAALALMKREMKGRREGETECLACFLSTSRGNTAWAGVWERQSQQLGAQQGAEGLLGRMEAKGIVGNYTGLERASNALIQQDIFIKKQGCRTGTKREREKPQPTPFFFLQLPRIRPRRNLLSSPFVLLLQAGTSLSNCPSTQKRQSKGEGEQWGCWRVEILLFKLWLGLWASTTTPSSLHMRFVTW